MHIKKNKSNGIKSEIIFSDFNETSSLHATPLKTENRKNFFQLKRKKKKFLSFSDVSITENQPLDR